MDSKLTFSGCSIFFCFGLIWLVCLLLPSSVLAFELVTVDPAGAVVSGTFGAEFNTDGNFEGWTTSDVADASVDDGSLQGTVSGAAPRVRLLDFAKGPDLDLGFNDFLDLRIQVPADYTGDVRIDYGTTGTPGIADSTESRVITIPPEKVAKDGEFHTYRLNLGLEVLWRSTLRDLRIDPLSGDNANGKSFAIDYVRVGDLPGDVYLPNTTDQPVTNYELTSKHFRFIWDATHEKEGMNATWAHGSLRNAEEVWQVYVNYLGYREPSESTDPARRDGKKYKVNFLCTFDGYWMGGSRTALGYFNVDMTGQRVDPPTWVTPHELMHVFQMHQGGDMPGEWWEPHANYATERWLHFYDAFFPNQSNIDAGCIISSYLMIAHGRDYYLTWPFFLYLDENPDNLPDLGPDTVAKMWQQNSRGVYPYATIEQLTPKTSVKDIVGYFARRMVTFDFASQSAIVASLEKQNPAVWKRFQITELTRCPDNPAWWRVPNEIAPMQGAYTIHELVPERSGSGRVVTVNFHGLPDSPRGSDWRAGFVAVADDGAERYTPLWNGGSNSIKLGANENRLYLAVAAAPDEFIYGGHDDLSYPYRAHPSKERFHYQLQVTGATPKESDNGDVSGLIQHQNGGGWKSPSATVDDTAYVGPNARVVDNAEVRNNARIEDYAAVRGTARVLGDAVVSGHALVWEKAVVQDNAKVRDWAIVSGGATISGNGRVCQHAQVGNGTVTDYATVKGCAMSWGGTVGGCAVVDGDYMIGRDLSSGFAFGHLPYVGVPDSWIRPAPDRICASYPFDKPHESIAYDGYGALDGFLRGQPVWIDSDAGRRGVYVFDGLDQYVVLERLVADTKEFTFAAWVKPLGGEANQPIVWVGSSSDKRLTLTPDDGVGHAKFVIANGGEDQTLTAPNALPLNEWSHLAVTLDGSTGVLYVNGTEVAGGAITIVPEQILPPNTGDAIQPMYLARSGDDPMPKYHGALDDVQFYTRALSAKEVAAIIPPKTLAIAGTLYVDLRASQRSAGEETWVNLGTLGEFSRIGEPSRVVDVGGTGIPGVEFDGVDDAYQGPNSVEDLDGGSDRTIEIWAYNPSVAEEETPVSWGHRGAGQQNMGFNFGNNGTWGAATHWDDDVAWGTPPTADAWHHLAYTYSDGVARVYVDGRLSNTKTLSSNLKTFANEPINLGCQREDADGTRSFYYSGYINTVRIHGGALSANEIAGNYYLGPASRPAE